MKLNWVAGISPIVTNAGESHRFYAEGLGLPLPSGDYSFTEELPGLQHFGLWPLSEAARSCFGTEEWPADLPIPQATLEFDLESPEAVEAAARELEAKGLTLLHPVRTEPWQQTLTRLISPEGLLIGISYTPWHRRGRPADMIPFLNSLHATRSFRADPVPDEALADILETARWTGSAMNKQPWHFVVVRDAAIRQQIAELSQGNAGFAAEAPVVIALVLNWDSPDLEGYDEGRLTERIIAAAAAHGLGSGIGWLRRPGAEENVKALLEIDPEKKLRSLVAVGYPSEGSGDDRIKKQGARKPLDDLVTWR